VGLLGEEKNRTRSVREERGADTPSEHTGREKNSSCFFERGDRKSAQTGRKRNHESAAEKKRRGFPRADLN